MIARVHANAWPTVVETISGQGIDARTLLDGKIDLVLTSGELHPDDGYDSGVNEALVIDLRNHAAAAEASLDLVRRAAASQRDRPYGAELAVRRDEVDQDRRTYRVLLESVWTPWAPTGSWCGPWTGRSGSSRSTAPSPPGCLRRKRRG